MCTQFKQFCWLNKRVRRVGFSPYEVATQKVFPQLFSTFHGYQRMTAELSKFYLWYFLPVAWPARSPDIIPMDLFSFWGYTKDQVNRTRVTCLQDLKQRVIHSVEGIRPQMCGNVFRAFERRTVIVRATKRAQVEVQRNGERWGKKLSE
jgi:hypothetical protein